MPSSLAVASTVALAIATAARRAFALSDWWASLAVLAMASGTSS